MKKLLAALTVAATTATLTAAPATAAPRRAAITDLGTLGGTTTEVFDLDDRGTAVGRSSTADGHTHAFRWSNGLMTDLGTLPGGTHSEAHGINENGVIAGTAHTATGETRAVIWRNGRIIDLQQANSQGWDINDDGQVLATRRALDYSRSRFLWQNRLVTDLGAENNYQRTTGKITNEAKVLMLFGAPGSPWNAGWQRYGATTTIGALGPDGPGANYPHDMNNTGLLVGWTDDEQGRRRPFQYPGPSDLGTLGGRDGNATAVNDAGTIAGVSQLPDGTSHPTLWRDGRITDLTTRGLTGTETPVALNNRGDLIATTGTRAVYITGATA